MEIFGTVATVCGDNPGSAAVAGFKESSSAFWCCRQCLATKEQMTSKVTGKVTYIYSWNACILHDMLEGYLPYKTKLMLHHFFMYVCM